MPGNRIALVAPAGPLLEKDDLTRAEILCRALGYDPLLGKSASARHGYMAGTDEERVVDLNSALADPSIDAVWCIRGGYGSLRLLDRVDYAAMARRPKALIGFSDITAVLNAVTHLTGVVTFHGPVARASMPAFNRWHFERVLTGTEPPGRLGRIRSPPMCSCLKRIASSPCVAALPKAHLPVAISPCSNALSGHRISPSSQAPSCFWKTWARTSTELIACLPIYGSAERSADSLVSWSDGSPG